MTVDEARRKTTLTVAEAADLLDCSEYAVRQGVATGALPVLRLSKRLLLPSAQLLRLLGLDLPSPVNDDAPGPAAEGVQFVATTTSAEGSSWIVPPTTTGSA